MTSKNFCSNLLNQPKLIKAAYFFAAILIALLLAGLCGCAQQNTQTKETLADKPAADNQFVVMSTTDMHGKVWDEDLLNDKPLTQNYLAASTAVSKIRSNFGERNVLVDNGDLFQGNDVSAKFMGTELTNGEIVPSPASVCLDKIKYDALNLGNHEFNYPVDQMKCNYSYLKDAGVNIISANVYYQSTGKRVFQPYILKKLNVDGQEITVAVIGLENTDNPRWDSPDNFPDMIFHAPENSTCDVSYEVEKVQKEMEADGIHPDCTIVAMHSGLFAEGTKYDPNHDYYKDVNEAVDADLVYGKNTENQVAKVAYNCHNIDMVISGHDHVTFYSNHEFTNSDNKQVMIVNGGTKDLTKTVFNVDKDANGKCKISIAESNNLDLADYESEPNLKKIIEPYASKVKDYLNQKCGVLTGNWDNGNKLEKDDILLTQTDSVDIANRAEIWQATNSLNKKYSSVADLNAKLSEIWPDKNYQYTDDKIEVDFSLSNNSVTNNPNDGDISQKGVRGIYKYDNILYAIPMTGQEIKNLLEFNASERFAVTDENGEKKLSFVNDMFTYVIPYGLNFVYDMNRPAGDRVVIDKFTNGKSFDLNKTYIMTLNNYQIGNVGNPELGKHAKDKYLYAQNKDDGDKSIPTIIADYIKEITDKYGAVHSTKEADQNGEKICTWSIKY